MTQDKKKHIAYAELINHCWEDAAYLEKFRKDPAAVLAEAGIETVPGARYHVLEQTAEHVYVILPAEATKEQEEAIAAQLKQRFQAQNGAPFEGKLEVVRNTKEDIYLPFTPAPKAQELSDEMVDQAAGGTNEHSKEFFFTVVDVVVLQNINVEAATVVYDMPVQVIGPSYPAVISAYSPDPVYITDPSKLPPAYVSAICQVM